MSTLTVSLNDNRRMLTAFVFAALTLGVAAPKPLQAQAFISEPSTVFYGKVVGTASAQNFLITDGTLVWTIKRSDGVDVTLQTSLYPLGDNTYSYRLNVPHSAVALGLSADANAIPMPPIPQVNVHTSVKIDGQTAALLGPAGSTFTTEQFLRTSTYRMDLGLNRSAIDSDGDGIPDWWEDQNGLDKQDPGDAALDLNGDGYSALYAYLNGLDPRRDVHAPTLLTSDVIVYLSGTTAILLDTFDLDSTASQQTFTLTHLPYAGTLSLRNAQPNPAQPNLVLEVGSQFTKADLLKGRLVYNHDGSTMDPGTFGVELRDENPANPVMAGTVNLLAYEPASLMSQTPGATELEWVDNHFAALHGNVILDGTAIRTKTELMAPSAGLSGSALTSFITTYGADRSYKIIGGTATNGTLTGGHVADILVAGVNGGVLTGGSGADQFVVQSFEKGLVSITDFNLSEFDVLDMSRMSAVPGAYVHQYLRLIKNGGVQYLQTGLKGNNTAFTNVTVALPGLSDADANLYSLVESGRLRVGALELEPMISVVASQPQASENGPENGVFTITRRGSLVSDLTVNLAIGGTAENGVDYENLNPTVLIPAGMASAEVTVVPNTDGVAEAAETVVLTVAAGSGYRLGSSTRATVTIEDMLMRVTIEAVDQIAVKQTGTPGRFKITRFDAIDRAAVIHVTVAGTASNGNDYNTIAAQVNLDANQTEAFVQVMPKPAALLDGGRETVVVSINADATYRVSGARAQVLIIERADSFADWRAREFPGVSGDAATFAAADSGQRGVSHLQRYAFGLDPHQPDQNGLPRPFLHNGRLVVTFRKPMSVQDNIVYRVRAVTNLMDPDGSELPMTVIAAPDGTDDPEQVYYAVDEEAAAGADAVFSIIEVEWRP